MSSNTYSSEITFASGLGSFFLNALDLWYSGKEISNLQAKAQKVGRTVEIIGPFAPEVQAEIAPCAEECVEKARKLSRVSFATIISDGCNCVSAGVNIITSALELWADKDSVILSRFQKIGTKCGYGVAAAANVYQAYVVSAACVKAVKNWWASQDPQSAKILKWHALNEGVKTVATLIQVGAYGDSISDRTMSVRGSSVAPAVVFALGAGVVTVTFDSICRRRMKAAQAQNPSNEQATMTMLALQPLDSIGTLADYFYQKRQSRHNLVQTMSAFPLKGVCSEEELPQSPLDRDRISPMSKGDIFDLPGTPEKKAKCERQESGDLDEDQVAVTIDD